MATYHLTNIDLAVLGSLKSTELSSAPEIASTNSLTAGETKVAIDHLVKQGLLRPAKVGVVSLTPDGVKVRTGIKPTKFARFGTGSFGTGSFGGGKYGVVKVAPPAPPQGYEVKVEETKSGYVVIAGDTFVAVDDDTIDEELSNAIKKFNSEKR